MLRNSSLAARLGLAAVLAVVAVARVSAQSAQGDDQSPAVERSEPEKELFAEPGNPPSPQDEADREEAKAAEKLATEVPAARTAPPEVPSASTAPPEVPSASTAPPEVPSAGTAPPEVPTAGTAPPKVPSAMATPPETTPPPAPAESATVAVDPVDPVIGEVRARLASAKLPDATAAERTALAEFYAGRKAPVWVAGADFTDRARHVMAEIARADEWGLEAKAFALPSAGDVTSTAALADTEIRLSVAVLKYARYARGGRLEPSQVSRNFDQKLSLRDPKVVLETVAGLQTPGSYLRALHPKHPQFELLRQALLKTRGGTGKGEQEAETRVQMPASGPVLKLGVDHPDVALLRNRLKVAATPGLENVFDEDVLAAVKAYQRRGGLRADGMVGPGTRGALNGTSSRPKLYGSDEERLIVNMERWRWMPEDMGEFHVWDNVPEFQARVVKNGRVVHQAKIIVGRRETQTTIFSASMRYIVFGPEWGVPDSIKVKELLPKLRPTFGGGLFDFGPVTDTSILERQNMRVVYKGKVVDASRIDWSAVDIRRYSFIQAAGPGNALGAVKFRFPNKHDIYMHDTPMRQLFNSSVRAYSHGCVRVEDPGRLAEVLLEEDKGWQAARVKELMARGGNVEVTLSKKVPVHITYFTAMAAEDGTVSYFSDLYGHDRRLAAALSGRPLPLEAVQSLDVAGQDTAASKKEARAKRYQKQAQEDFFSGLFGN
jgi:murein L,D-transpeptidase YcbB/YkuD